MAINFPVGIDDLANVGTGDTITPAHKNNLNDIVEALEAKVGIDSSAVATSHDYLLTHLPSQAGNWDAGAVEVRAQTFESDIATGTAPFTIASTTVSTNLNADLLDGNHAAAFQTVLTNSAGLRAALNDETGTGLAVFNTTPTLITPVLGVATATTINKVTITAPAASATLTIANTKTLNVTDDATISGTPYTPGGTDVALTDGGTGQSTAQAAINALAGGVTANKVLRGDGSNILLAAVNMATDVTGTLAVANGGTASTTAANARTALGLVIGTDVLAPNGDGSSLTGISIANGGAATISGSSYTDITYTRAFSDTNYGVLATRNDGQAAGITISNKTTTGCRINNGNAGSVAINWIAASN